MGWFLLYLFLALQAAACVIAVVARSWKLKPDLIVWRGTDVDVAATNVQQFLIDIDDSRFAYPTGMFVPDSASDPLTGRVVMTEENFKGSHGVGWAFRVFGAFHRAWQHKLAMETEAPIIIIVLYPFWMMFAGFLAAPFLVASILDIGYRQAFRSRITAAVTKHPTLEDAVDIRLEFSGLSAFGLVPDALRGMTAPTLPAGLVAADSASAESDAETRTLAAVGGRAAAWARGSEQRFRVIYSSAIGAAVLVAAILALTVHHGVNTDYYPGPNTANVTDQSGNGYQADNGNGNVDPGTTTDSGNTPTDTTTTDTTTTDTTPTDTTPTDTRTAPTDQTTTGPSTTATTTTQSNGTQYSLVADVTGGVTVRAGPSSRAAAVATISPTATVAIVCTVHGAPVTRNGSTESLWDRIAQPSGYVSDMLIQTGSSSPVAGACSGAASQPSNSGNRSPTVPSSGSTGSGTSTPTTPSTDQASGVDPNEPTPPAPGDLQTGVSQFNGFTVQLPGGSWIIDQTEVSKPGYVDTRWHLDGNPDVGFVVDYTRNFSGDALAAANSVRKLFSHASGYQLHDFAPITVGSTPARRWEYTDLGEHSVDIFMVICGTSYAVRGGTPDGAWSSGYDAIFLKAAQSLSPSC